MIFPIRHDAPFERCVSQWRALHGPAKTVMIEQIHHPDQFATNNRLVHHGIIIEMIVDGYRLQATKKTNPFPRNINTTFPQLSTGDFQIALSRDS